MKQLFFPLLGFVLGWVAVGTIRFATFHDATVHHHANFSLQINGTAVDFSQEKYQEDVSACAVEGAPMTPRQRAHLHNGNGNAVHVHTGGVTWGQFFQSLGFTIAKTAIIDDAGNVFPVSTDNPLKILVNGVETTSIVDRPILSEDRLLIVYGNLTAASLADRLRQVPDDAATLNATSDPATCSGHALSTGDKLLKSYFWK